MVWLSAEVGEGNSCSGNCKIPQGESGKKTVSTRIYDVIIIGENVAGLIAAALLSARRYSVLLVRRAAGPGSEHYLGSSVRRVRPIYPGVFDYPVPAAVIRELNLGHKFRSVFKPSLPLFQLIDPNHRLTISDDRLKLVQEFQREFRSSTIPDDVGNLLTQQEELNRILDGLLAPETPFFPESLRDKWEYNSRVKDFKRRLDENGALLTELRQLWGDTELGRYMAKLQMVVADAQGGKLKEFLAYRNGATLFSQVLYQVSGEGIDEVLLEKLDKRGGTVVEQTALQKIEVGRSGFKLHDGKNTYAGNSLICGFDFFLLPELIDDKKIDRFVSAQLARVKPVKTWVKVSFMIERGVIPEGMETYLFKLGDRPDDLLFFARDPLAPDESDVERLDVYKPIAAESVTSEKLRDAQHGVIDQVKWLVPFLENRLRKVYLEQLPAEDVENKWLNLKGRRLMYDTRDQDAEIGAGVPIQLPFKHGYLAGPENFPELGLEGDFVTGWSIARQICAKRPKKDDLR